MRGHLVRRGGVYWFRRRVPGPLAERLGRREIHRSLKTASPGKAAERANSAWLATQVVFEAMSKNPSLQQRQALLIIERLLSEPVEASETSSELLADHVDGSSALIRSLTRDKAWLAPRDAAALSGGAEAAELGLTRIGGHPERFRERCHDAENPSSVFA